MNKQEILKRCCRVIPFDVIIKVCITPCPYGTTHKIIPGVIRVGSILCGACEHNVETNAGKSIVFCKNPKEHNDDK